MLRNFFMLHHAFYRCSIIVVISTLFLFSRMAQAEPATSAGRYLVISHEALPQQINLLDQTFQVHFSHDIHTVGDAMRYLLQFSGYRLVNAARLSRSVQALLLQPLPPAHRKLGPMALQAGLLTLAGSPFGLVVDPVHRLIGFRLKPAFQSLYGEV